MSDTTATPEQAVTHDPCCSSHDVPMSCERYRYTHFVEVGPCCAAWDKPATHLHTAVCEHRLVEHEVAGVRECYSCGPHVRDQYCPHACSVVAEEASRG